MSHAIRPAFCALALLLAGAVGSAAEVDRKTQPAAEPLPKATFPEFKQTTLANGLKVFLLETDKQQTISFRLVIKAGAAAEGNKHGLAGMVAALLNKGTKNLSAEEFARQADRLGISVEAAASDDAIYISGTGLSKHAEEVLRFIREAVLEPLFPGEQLEKERVKALSRIEAEKKEPGALASKLRDQVIFGEHPYGAHATSESIQKITRAGAVAFHDKHFVPNNASLGVTGDFDREKLLPKIRETFGDWERGKATAVAPPKRRVKGVEIHLVDRPGSVQSNIIVAANGIPRNNPKTPELSVVNSVLGGGFSGRLFQNLRERNAFTYGSSSNFDQRKLGGVFSATAEVRNEVTGKAATEILNELKRIREEPIPAPELDLQKQYVAGNYLLSLESDRRNLERVQDLDLFGLPKDYYQTLISRIREVDPNEAQSLARKYIPPKDVAIIVVGDADQIRPQLEPLGPVTVYDADLKTKK